MLAAAFLLASCRPQPQAVRKPAEFGWRPSDFVFGPRKHADRFLQHWKRPVADQVGDEPRAIAGQRNLSGDRPQSGERTVCLDVCRLQGEGSGVAYVTEDPRQFFLVIESSGVDWNVWVEEGVIGGS